MTAPATKTTAFHKLHQPGDPLVLFNAWDAGSAAAVVAAGSPAVATGSWSVAAAQGYDDGEAIPLELLVTIAHNIVRHVDVPVSLDFEGGYARDTAQLTDNIARVLDTGIVGINFEDQIMGQDVVYDIAEQAARVSAVRAAAERAGVALYVNARTDLFLLNAPEHHGALMDDALARAAAYADAGASGFFVPGLVSSSLIAQVCAASRIPVNVMAGPTTPDRADLATRGVARISHGPGPYRAAMARLEDDARDAIKPALR